MYWFPWVQISELPCRNFKVPTEYWYFEDICNIDNKDDIEALVIGCFVTCEIIHLYQI